MRGTAALATLALLCAAGLAAAQQPVNVPGYNCPSSCDSQPNCYCATHDVPGGLPASSIPQFVVLTNDDAVTVTTQPVIMDIVGKHSNPNGCNIPATWFVSINYTDYHLIQEAYMASHEIATHTVNHVADPDVVEIVGAKMWLNQTAHVPLEKIRGFRAPFLIHNPAQRTILQQNGFVFDSSIPEPFPTATSPDPNVRLWPYTMDYGLPQRCDLGTGPCSVNESHPGLWEFPMWDVQDANGKVLTNMDPQGNLYDAYKREFDRNYNGNRAPVGVFIHAAWLMDPTRNAEMNQFIQYALSKPDVWFVTVSDVLDWIKNPVPASQYARACPTPTDMWFPSGRYCPVVQCVHGNWSDYTCSCTCAGEFLTNQPGFCLDPTTQACTVPKTYDAGSNTFVCPYGAQHPNPPSPSPMPTTVVGSGGGASNAQSCGHPLLDFQGLVMSGARDNAYQYMQALKAVDGLCNTCANASDPNGNYLMVALQEPTAISGVFVQTATNLTSAFVFVGNSSDNNGLTNPVCASKVNVPAETPAVIECNATGSYITIAVPGSFSICDIYITLPGESGTGVNLQSGGAIGPASALSEVINGTLAGLTGSQAAAVVARNNPGQAAQSAGASAGATGSELGSFGVAQAQTIPYGGAEGKAMTLAAQEAKKKAKARKARKAVDAPAEAPQAALNAHKAAGAPAEAPKAAAKKPRKAAKAKALQG